MIVFVASKEMGAIVHRGAERLARPAGSLWPRETPAAGRSRMSSTGLRPIALVVLLASAVLSFPLVARGQVAALRAQRESVYARAREARSMRNVAVNEAARQRAALRACERRLAEARNSVRRAEKRLHDTRQAIADAERAVHEAEKRLAEQEALAAQRIVAMHKCGQVSYLEVFVGARDFTELAGRAYLFEELANCDADLMRRIDECRRDAADRKAELEKQRERVKEEKRKLEEAKQRIAVETARQAELTAAAQAEVDKWSRQIAELEATSRALTASIRAMTAGSSGYTGVPWSGGWLKPAGGTVTSGYGMRFHPIAHVVRHHDGVDISAPMGSPVIAAGTGKVIYSGWMGGYGNTVIIDHGGGKTTLYGHLSSIQASVGQEVSSGARIGSVGSTGYSTGPHLHWEVRHNGSPVNPLR